MFCGPPRWAALWGSVLISGQITFVSQAEIEQGGGGCVLSKHTMYLLDGRTLNAPVMVIGAARFKLDTSKTDLLWVIGFISC